MMIKDRGTIKWTAMMLPEHVSMLKTLWNDVDKVERPMLDEHELQLLNSIIYEAFTYKQKLVITYYRNGTYNLIIGMISTIDSIQKQIYIKDHFNETFKIHVEDIVSAVQE